MMHKNKKSESYDSVMLFVSVYLIGWESSYEPVATQSLNYVSCITDKNTVGVKAL